MTEVMVNLGELFEKAKEGQPTKRQRNPQRKGGDKMYKNDYKASGIQRVAKVNNNAYKQGYCFRFSYKDGVLHRTLQSQSLLELHNKMQKKGFSFVIEDNERAIKFLKEYCNKEEYKIIFEKYFVD